MKNKWWERILLGEKINRILKKEGFKYEVFVHLSNIKNVRGNYEKYWTIRREHDFEILALRDKWEKLENFVQELETIFDYYRHLFEV